MNWHCIHTKPRKEQQVARYLNERLGLETYFPLLKRQKTVRRVRRLVTGPLFPRYLFSQFEVSTSYRAVRYCPDVLDIVSAGDRPAIVSTALIEELKAWAGDAVNLITLQPDLSPGDRVEITEGPMRGLPAVILHIKNDSERVAVLLSFLESTAKMIIKRSQLAPIDES